MSKGDIEKAIAVFGINAEAYPQSSNAFYSLGEAFMKKGDREKAIENYKKSIALNPGNKGSMNRLKELGVNTEDIVKEIVVTVPTLESYAGQYQLAPGFILTVTREGSQLNAQGTGQQAFPIFPTFNQNEEGKVQSVTSGRPGNHWKENGKMKVLPIGNIFFVLLGVQQILVNGVLSLA